MADLVQNGMYRSPRTGLLDSAMGGNASGGMPINFNPDGGGGQWATPMPSIGSWTGGGSTQQPAQNWWNAAPPGGRVEPLPYLSHPSAPSQGPTLYAGGSRQSAAGYSGAGGNASGGMPIYSSREQSTGQVGSQQLQQAPQNFQSIIPTNGSGYTGSTNYFAGGGPTLYAGGSQNSAAQYNGSTIPPTGQLIPGTNIDTAARYYHGAAYDGTPASSTLNKPGGFQAPSAGVSTTQGPTLTTQQGGGGVAYNAITPPTQPTQPAQPTAATYPGGVSRADVPAVAQAQYQTIDPILRQVQDSELSQQQLYKMLEADSPLIKQARTAALEQMQARGLLNSSMAVGAAEKAAWQAAEPFAMQDARAYAEAARDNQQAGNMGLEFNAGAFNRNQEANVGFLNTRGENLLRESGQDRRLDVQEGGLDRRQLVTEGGLNSRLQVTEGGLDRRQQVTEGGLNSRLQISESGETARSDARNATSLRQTQMQNDTTLAATRMNNDVSMATASMNADTQRYTAGLQAQTNLTLEGMRERHATTLDNSRAANNIVTNYASQAAAIMANPDMDEATKRRALDNLQEIADRGLALAGSTESLDLRFGDD